MIPREVADDATHGSFCPKMCNHACPVLAATGREGAAPWALHVTVAGLASGDRPEDAEAYADLRGCTGCHACRSACLYDLDVPAEVRAARRHLLDRGVTVPGVDAVVRTVADRRSPYLPEPIPLPEGPDGAETVVVVGCAESQDEVDALAAVLEAAGVPGRFVAPDGCCGAVLRDLGAEEAAAAARERLAQLIGGASGDVVATDPHCVPTLREIVATEPRTAVELVAELVSAGRIALTRSPSTVTFHDPCVLARDERVVDQPRTLLEACGAEIAEPHRTGASTACSGAGMGFDLVDPDAADAVARRRLEDLRAAGGRLVTACARAGARLRTSGGDAEGLVAFVARHLEDQP